MERWICGDGARLVEPLKGKPGSDESLPGKFVMSCENNR
jgi:hypothetical protein